jgi:hypothetical protein
VIVLMDFLIVQNVLGENHLVAYARVTACLRDNLVPQRKRVEFIFENRVIARILLTHNSCSIATDKAKMRDPSLGLLEISQRVGPDERVGKVVRDR